MGLARPNTARHDSKANVAALPMRMPGFILPKARREGAHLPTHESCYMQLGCTNCGCMTPHYQPHQDQECLRLLGVPANISGKQLKVHCRTTFREFIAQVLGWDVKASRCRFRYTTPSIMTTPMLANFAAAGTNEA